MTTSDRVLLVSTLVLAIAAFLTPVIGERIKERFYKPVLSLEVSGSPPASHMTTMFLRLSAGQVQKHKEFYCRVTVANTGKVQAKRCELVIESVSKRQPEGRYVPYPRYTPVNLVWGAGEGDFVDINPGRHFYGDFVKLPDAEAQRMIEMMGGYVNGENESGTELGIVLATKHAFYSQPNRLGPGQYRIVIGLFSENANTVRRTFAINWSGVWQDIEADVFRELIVVPVRE